MPVLFKIGQQCCTLCI